MLKSSIFATILFSTVSAFASGEPATALELNGAVSITSCSGALVDLGNREDSPAYVLSAGHCPTYPYFVAPGKAFALDGNRWPKTNGYPLGASLETPVHIEIEKLIYATLTNADVALFKTRYTVGELRMKGYRIFTVADSLPAPGARLRVTSAYWKQTQPCTVDRILRTNADELEIDPTSLNGYEFRNSIYFDQNCLIRSGWSGSPVFDEKDGKIYGVASRRIIEQIPKLSLLAGTVDLMKFIGFNQASTEFGTLVASNVSDLKSCLTEEGNLDLSAADCALPKIDPKAVPNVKPSPSPTQSPGPNPSPRPSPSKKPVPQKKPRTSLWPRTRR